MFKFFKNIYVYVHIYTHIHEYIYVYTVSFSLNNAAYSVFGILIFVLYATRNMNTGP
jgi:hypothetical protein